MIQDDFQTLVLQELRDIKTDVGVLKTDVGTLKSDVGTLKSDVGTLKSDMALVKKDISSLHTKFDRLDDRVDDMESSLKQEIRLQGAYLNQAFDRMSYMQQTQNTYSASRISK